MWRISKPFGNCELVQEKKKKIVLRSDLWSYVAGMGLHLDSTSKSRRERKLGPPLLEIQDKFLQNSESTHRPRSTLCQQLPDPKQMEMNTGSTKEQYQHMTLDVPVGKRPDSCFYYWGTAKDSYKNNTDKDALSVCFGLDSAPPLLRMNTLTESSNHRKLLDWLSTCLNRSLARQKQMLRSITVPLVCVCEVFLCVSQAESPVRPWQRTVFVWRWHVVFIAAGCRSVILEKTKSRLPSLSLSTQLPGRPFDLLTTPDLETNFVLIIFTFTLFHTATTVTIWYTSN